MKVCAPAAAAKPPKDRSVGAAAEHYVMRRLLRQDMIAALAPAGVPNCDLVVTDELGSKVAAVQVKARRDIGSDGGWHMKKKHEAMIEPLLFYCFVDFGRGGPTDRSAGSFQAPSWPTPSNEVIRRGSRAGQGRPPKNATGTARRARPSTSAIRRQRPNSRGAAWPHDEEYGAAEEGTRI